MKKTTVELILMSRQTFRHSLTSTLILLLAVNIVSAQQASNYAPAPTSVYPTTNAQRYSAAPQQNVAQGYNNSPRQQSHAVAPSYAAPRTAQRYLPAPTTSQQQPHTVPRSSYPATQQPTQNTAVPAGNPPTTTSEYPRGQAIQPYRPQSPVAAGAPTSSRGRYSEIPAAESPRKPAISSDSNSQHAIQTSEGSANPAKAETTDPAADVQKIEAAIKELEATEGLEPEKKEARLELLRKAIKWATLAKESRAKAEQYETHVKLAPERVAEAKQQLAETLPEPQPQFAPDATLVQLEQGLSQAEEELKQQQEDLAKSGELADSTRQTEQKSELAKRKEELKTQLKEMDEGSDGGAKEGESSKEAQIEVAARRYAWQQQIKMLDAERLRGEAMVEAYPILRDLAQRRVAHTEKLVAAWREVVTQFRKAESQRQAEEARRIASEAHPALRDLAERNAQLAEMRTELAKQLDGTSTNLERVAQRLKDLKADYESITEKVKVAGMTPTIGLLLRDRRDRLPAVERHEKQIVVCGEQMQAAQVSLLELETEREQLGDLDEKIEAVISDLGAVREEFAPGYLDGMVRQLMHDRREYIDSLLTDLRSHHEDLNDLELATRELLVQVVEYRGFVNEHVLWIRSDDRLSMADVSRSKTALKSVADPGRWSAVLTSTRRNVSEHPWASAMVALLVVALIGFRRFQKRLEAIGHRVANGEDASFLLTLQALMFTALMSALWPTTFFAIGWWMSINQGAPDLALAVAAGLKNLAVTFYVAELFRQICRPQGLADKHFAWPQQRRRALHKNLVWLMRFGLPTIFLLSLFDTLDGGQWKDSLGRLSFLTGLVVLATFMHFMLRPWRMQARSFSDEASVDWGHRLRYFWYVLGVGIPLGMVTLLVLGYSYSAEQLMLRCRNTLAVLLTLMLVREIALGGLSVAWRRVQRFKQLRQESEPTDTSSGELLAEEAQAAAEEASRVENQLGQLVRGLATLTLLAFTAWIWADMFPALQVLDRVEMWSTAATVSQDVTLADGSVVTEQVPQLVPITLSDVLIALVLLVATWIASRSLPGLLEVAVLGRLPIERGASDAIVIICRYVLTIVGVVIACHTIGMKWASVQWLAAAMSVGLGFGLQEIFANLVSGLIILFERPIRLGDLVTVNGITGRVTKMQIRATTLTDPDRRELIVPNKRFITDDVVNWTLSDPITRVVLPVGVSYDTDPTRAHDLLLDVARRHPLVLSEPEPSALFVNFGDSTLDFELRVFMGSRDHYTTVLHEVNLAIERTFREAGIEIAFPQQDLHIRTIDGLPLASSEQDVEQPSVKKAA